jgi:hypothetical protein
MPTDKINLQNLAEQYGFAYSMIRSNNELYNLFKKAVAQTWDQTRIMTEVRATNWYKKNSESERNAAALRASDPATYKQQLQQQRVRVRMMATEWGARISSKTINELANHVLAQGWDDNQLRSVMGRYIRYSDGRLLGQAGAMEAEWRQYADQMGVGVGDSQVRQWAAMAVNGRITPQDVLSRIKEMAKSKYAGFADRIEAGETVAAIAEPYKQAMGEILEINPGDVNIRRDRQIQTALQARNNKGVPEPMTTWEFENRLRKDPRWRMTKNAEENLMEVGHQVLRDFGVAN